MGLDQGSKNIPHIKKINFKNLSHPKIATMTENKRGFNEMPMTNNAVKLKTRQTITQRLHFAGAQSPSTAVLLAITPPPPPALQHSYTPSVVSPSFAFVPLFFSKIYPYPSPLFLPLFFLFSHLSLLCHLLTSFPFLLSFPSLICFSVPVSPTPFLLRLD